jgi:hypothetical protein
MLRLRKCQEFFTHTLPVCYGIVMKRPEEKNPAMLFGGIFQLKQKTADLTQQDHFSGSN